MIELERIVYKDWYRWTWPAIFASIAGFWATFAYLAVIS